MDTSSETYIFEEMPIPRAVAKLAVPTVISQVVTMIYNLADTFFIGQLANPAMSAGVSLVSPYFNLLTALGNLFGLGGGSLISRMLGSKDEADVKYVSSFALWGGIAATLLFSVLTYIFRGPILRFLGALDENIVYAETYLNWVVVLGGAPTMVSLSLGNLLRSEGHAREASAGMMFGGILNVILDPILIFPLHLDVAGAAIATAFSNLASVAFFAVVYIRLEGHTFMSFLPRYFTFRFTRQIFSVGVASAISTALGNAATMVMMNLASAYGTVAEAAYGIVKRIDQFPLNVSMGLCQGFMPLIGYNYASGDYRRMRGVASFSWKVSLIISACFVALFFFFASPIVHRFIPDPETSSMGAGFLRVACLSVPLTAINFMTSYALQAMGKGLQSSLITLCRQGALYIPAMLIMDAAVGLDGLIWAQPIIEALMLPITFGIYFYTLRHLPEPASHS
ncbi:MAG TPA: MATE family efflux transporter [Candidatus Scatomorpha gallistercoris]|nr:MATE family efflux transporter [Candidatus Scatomorpha gallistercoris]